MEALDRLLRPSEDRHNIKECVALCLAAGTGHTHRILFHNGLQRGAVNQRLLNLLGLTLLEHIKHLHDSEQLTLISELLEEVNLDEQV